ncbi:HNH endonuclease [Nocardioides piscis]|uniref:DUF222 domain-containing protein n=1 Tax=Nocardioides piscis TaxID=2714938 RepID=A0A6G7YDV1_9ACTN|nr:HNH endonuclease [Nocardioides piscis]QIK74787.1 DUF222 domain-containing protein [Nocardioides piscis]
MATPPAAPAAAPDDSLRAMAGALLATPVAADPKDCIDQLDALERLKSAISAAQARVTHSLDQHRQAQAEARRMLEPTRRWPNPDAGIGKEIGLARRESPHDGRRKLNLARALVRDLPETLAALERGDINERRAEIIAGETADLEASRRRAVDAAVSHDLAGLGDADLRDRVRREVLRRDDAGWLARHERARAKRRVSGRIIGDGMARLTALLPAADVALIMTSLSDAAEAARARGDERSRGQLVADTLVGRLGGLSRSAPLPTALKLIVSAETLLGDGREPGYVMGAGYVPASVARSLALAGAQHASSTIQRLFAMPRTGALLAVESASSFFRGGLADLIDLRDRRCRSPYCNAPIRHRDHVVSRAQGGATDLANAQGLCEACNYAKESPGWRHEPVADPLTVTEIVVTTPTGHRHRSRAPDPPIDRSDPSPLERLVSARLLAVAG